MTRPVEVALPAGHADAIGPTPYPMVEAPVGLLPPVVSFAKGLPRVYLVEAGEVPPPLDPADVDPLRPETWRAHVPAPAPLPLPSGSSRELGQQALACLKRLGLWLLVMAVALACSSVSVVH